MLNSVTRILLFANICGFALQWIAGDALIRWLALWPLETPIEYDVRFWPWQVITYGFLHGDIFHLAFNMFALYMFGEHLERVFGERRFLLYYLGCVFSAAIVQLLFALVTQGPAIPTVGASGGVFGLLLAYGMLFPHHKIIPLFPPIPMPAWVFVSLYGAAELFFGVTGTMAGVAHFAHLGGMVGGYLLIRAWTGRRY